ncbi:MAG: DUF2855 family protein [Myxococcota bacterium]|nr:DUF2855 family protein [Myxococcota bacterium]
MTDVDFTIDKAKLEQTRRDPAPERESIALGADELLLAVRTFGLTANNITYGAFGAPLGYWNYFPCEEESRGHLPVWGFAEVVRSESDAIEVGETLFGFLPMSSLLVVKAADVEASHFHDASAHRSALHPWYNRYYRCGGDPLYDASRADLQPIYWPLFMTGWMLAATYEASGDHGAERVYVTSASSKTSISFAHAMAQRASHPSVVGLTSPANRGFVEGLGCYDEVVTYDELGADGLRGPAAFIDMAGNRRIAALVHETLGDELRQSTLVGATHRDASPPAALPGPAPEFFFIPDVAEQRAAEIGRDAYHAEFAAAWRDFADFVAGHTKLRVGEGPDALEAAYAEALRGDLRPEEGLLVRLQR